MLGIRCLVTTSPQPMSAKENTFTIYMIMRHLRSLGLTDKAKTNDTFEQRLGVQSYSVLVLTDS